MKTEIGRVSVDHEGESTERMGLGRDMSDRCKTTVRHGCNDVFAPVDSWCFSFCAWCWQDFDVWRSLLVRDYMLAVVCGALCLNIEEASEW